MSEQVTRQRKVRPRMVHIIFSAIVKYDMNTYTLLQRVMVSIIIYIYLRSRQNKEVQGELIWYLVKKIISLK